MRSAIAITGAAGFIGSNLVASLNEQGFDNLLLVDTLGNGTKWKNLRGLSFRDIIPPDRFLQQELPRSNGSNYQAIVHLGACSSTTETNADYLLENNYRYTRALCEWSLGHDSRFVYASSAATYGDGSLGFTDTDDVTAQLRPLNMYGYSKQLVDMWALRTGLFDRIVGLKFFNVYGPREAHKNEMRSVVHKAFEQILSTGSIQLFKSYRPDVPDGGQSRDFVYVKDAVDVIRHFVENVDSSGLLNCGTGQSRTWLDLANAVFVAMGRQVSVDFVEMPEALRKKYQYWTQADLRKLRTAGYGRAFTSLDDGVDDYVRWLVHEAEV